MMMSLTSLLRFTALIASVVSAGASLEPGTVEVEEFSLPHLAQSYDIILKVDKAYPYGEDQDAYKEICKEYKELLVNGRVRKDFLFATMSVQSYGDEENKEFAKSLGAKDEDKFPEYFYLKKGEDITKAIQYDGTDKKFDSVATFIKQQAGIRIGQSLLPEMDTVAAKFVMADDEKAREKLAEEASTVAKSFSSQGDRDTAEVYLKVISKALTKGMDYFKSESERLKRMLGNGTMKKEKKELFEEKLKVLASFTNPIPADEL